MSNEPGTATDGIEDLEADGADDVVGGYSTKKQKKDAATNKQKQSKTAATSSPKASKVSQSTGKVAQSKGKAQAKAKAKAKY